MRGMRVVERSFSDLLRYPNDVAADLDVGDVLLCRRDEPDLLLGLAECRRRRYPGRADTERDAERSDVFRALAVTFRSLATRTPSVLAEAVLDAFAWTEFLPVKDRRLFLDEFSRTLMASATRVGGVGLPVRDRRGGRGVGSDLLGCAVEREGGVGEGH